MGTGVTLDESLAGQSDVTPRHDDRGSITTISGSEQELFDAAQRHLAHHHPQFLGALGLDVVHQMAEDVRGR